MHFVDTLQQFASEHAALSYGLIFLGVLIEGEFTLIVAGVFSNLRILPIADVVVVGLAGAIAKAVSWYYLGAWMNRVWPGSRFFHFLKRRVLYFLPRFIERPFWSVFVSKFVYGVNHVTLIFSGFVRINFKTYVKAEFLSSLIWVPAILSIGYFFSYAAFNISHDVRKYTLIIGLFIVGFVLLERLLSFIFQLVEEYGNQDIL